MNSPTSMPAEHKVVKFHRWHRLVLSICFIIFAGELGFCLIVLPWNGSWEMSYIPVHSPRFSALWMSLYFRGALSGLGLLNVYVALAEAGRVVRSLLGKGQ